MERCSDRWSGLKMGKDVSGGSVITDVGNNFKWRRSECSVTAPYLCELWRPDCPNGYTFVPNAGNTSCFKVTEKAAAEDDTDKMFPSISIADKRCLRDGTSLAAPGS